MRGSKLKGYDYEKLKSNNEQFNFVEDTIAMTPIAVIRPSC